MRQRQSNVNVSNICLDPQKRIEKIGERQYSNNVGEFSRIYE